MNVNETREDYVPSDKHTNGVSKQQSAEHPMVKLLTADEFFAPENGAHLVVPALGICPGPPTGFSGQSYVGKTIAALSLGMATALGKTAWGTWRTSPGPWLHLDYEQGRRQTKERTHRLARGFGISDDELRAHIVAGQIRIAVLPDLRLNTDAAAEHYARAFEGVRMVTCDSLRPMLGGVDENSSQVRSLIAELTRASDKTDAAVLLILHGGKTPDASSNRTRKDSVRGSSAIVDELQSMFVATKAKGEHVALVTHEKDRELGALVPDFGLRIEDVPDEDDPKWGLQVMHVDRAEIKAGLPTGDAKLAQAVASVRECIKAHPGVAGNEAVREILGGTMATIRAAIHTLRAEGEVVERRGPGKGNSRRLYLTHAAPAEVQP